MADLDSSDDLGSIFEEPERVSESASDPGSDPLPDTLLGALVGEFLSLDRRRVHGDPPLDLAETEHLAEIQERLVYELGAGSPPLTGSRRRSLRVPTQLKVNLSGGVEAVANLCSLSLGGAFIETSDPLAAGTALGLAIDPGGSGAATLRVAATVKWVREIANMDGPAGVGVEFVGIEDDDFIALEKLVIRALRARALDHA